MRHNPMRQLRRFGTVLLLLPTLLAVSFYLRAPYFPSQFDDAEHWIFTAKIALAPGWAAVLHNAYLLRGMRPVAFPALGVPFFLMFHSVQAASLVLLCSLLAAFTLIAFALARRCGLAVREALLIALALSLQPMVFNSSLAYLAELPFLTFAAAALFFYPRRPILAGALVGFTLCLRPAEAGYLWACLFAYGFWNGERGDLGKTCASAFALAAVWFAPSSVILERWIVGSFLDQHPGPAGPLLSERLSTASHLALQVYSPVGVTLIALAIVLAIRFRPRGLGLALLLGVPPLAFTLFLPNRASAGQERYFLATGSFCLGLLLSLASRDRRSWFILPAVLAWNTWASIASFSEFAGLAELHRDTKALCHRYLDPLPLPAGSRLLVVGKREILPLPCTLAALEQGKDWEVRVTWDDRASAQQLAYDNDGILVIGETVPSKILEDAIHYGEVGESHGGDVHFHRLLGHVAASELCKSLPQPKGANVLWIQETSGFPCREADVSASRIAGIDEDVKALTHSSYTTTVVVENSRNISEKFTGLQTALAEHSWITAGVRPITAIAGPLRATIYTSLAEEDARRFCVEELAPAKEIKPRNKIAHILYLNDAGLELTLKQCENAAGVSLTDNWSMTSLGNFVDTFEAIVLLTDDEARFFRHNELMTEIRRRQLRETTSSQYYRRVPLSVRLGERKQNLVVFVRTTE